MTEIVVRKELDRWQWIKAVHQKTHNLIENHDTRNESLTDEEESLLEMYFRDYERGVFPVYESVMDVKETSVTEIGLFSADMSVNNGENNAIMTEVSNGTELVTLTSETKTEEENEQEE